MPSVRSVARAFLALLGLGLVAAGLAIAIPALGAKGFPAGLALGLGVLLFAAGGAALGGAALLADHRLRRSQRLGLKLAGVLAIAAFVVPAIGTFVAPEAMYRLVDAPPTATAFLVWLYLTTIALLVGLLVVGWRVLELGFEVVRARW